MPVVGRSAPRMFYVADNGLAGYSFGCGDPPASSVCAVGGLGPIIINGLQYGVGNVCGIPPGCPITGAVSATQRAAMTQRNNSTYAAQQSKSSSTGKTIGAHHAGKRKLLIISHADGSAGVTMDDIRAKLVACGCENAVFLDGSDSAFLFANGAWHVRAASNKNESNTIGISFAA